MAKPKKELSEKPADDSESESQADRPKRKIIRKKKDDDFVHDVPKKKQRLGKSGAGNHVEEEDHESSDDDVPLKSPTASPRAKATNSSPPAKPSRACASTSPKPTKKKAESSGNEPESSVVEGTSPKSNKDKSLLSDGEVTVSPSKAKKESKKTANPTKTKTKKEKSTKDTVMGNIGEEGIAGNDATAEIPKKSKTVKPKVPRAKKAKKVIDKEGADSSAPGAVVNSIDPVSGTPSEKTDVTSLDDGSKKKEKTDSKTVKCKRKPKAKVADSSDVQDVTKSLDGDVKTDTSDSKPKPKRRKSSKKQQGDGHLGEGAIGEPKSASDSKIGVDKKPAKPRKKAKKSDEKKSAVPLATDGENVPSIESVSDQTDKNSNPVQDGNLSSHDPLSNTEASVSYSLPSVSSDDPGTLEKPATKKRRSKKKEESGEVKPTKVKKSKKTVLKVPQDGALPESDHADKTEGSPTVDSLPCEGSVSQGAKGKKCMKKTPKKIPKSVEGPVNGPKKRKRKSEKAEEGKISDENPLKVKKPRVKKKKLSEGLEEMKEVRNHKELAEQGGACDNAPDSKQMQTVITSETTNPDVTVRLSETNISVATGILDVVGSDSAQVIDESDTGDTKVTASQIDAPHCNGNSDVGMVGCIPKWPVSHNGLASDAGMSPVVADGLGSSVGDNHVIPSEAVTLNSSAVCATAVSVEVPMTEVAAASDSGGSPPTSSRTVDASSENADGGDGSLNPDSTYRAMIISESTKHSTQESNCLSVEGQVSDNASPASRPVTFINGVLLKPSADESSKSGFDVYDLIDEDVQLPARPSGCDRTGSLYPRSPKGTTVIKSDEVRCERCGLIWPTTQKLLKHLENCKGTAGTTELKRHKCRQCEYQSKWSFLVRKHEQTHGIFTCQHCEHLCQADDELQDHIQKEHPNKKKVKAIKCTKCLAKITTDYDEHLETCPGKKVYSCSKCNKTFKFECRLTKHMLCHETEKRIKCELCEFRTNIKASLAKHVRTAHKENKEVFFCPECNKSYASEGYLKRHRKIHADASYACETCGKSFKLLSSLKGHITEVHNPPEQSVCNIEACGQLFDNRKLLKLHLVEAHQLGIRKFNCPFEGCEHVFYKYSHLKRHQATHSGERKFKCDWPECGKAFRHADNLKVHYRQHTNEKPFKCDQCDFACRQKSSLQWHLKRRHLPDGEAMSSKGIMPSGSENSMTSEGELTESDKASDSVTAEPVKTEKVPKKHAKKHTDTQPDSDKTSSDTDNKSKPKTVAKKSKKSPKQAKKVKKTEDGGSEIKKKKKKKKVKKVESEVSSEVVSEPEAKPAVTAECEDIVANESGEALEQSAETVEEVKQDLSPKVSEDVKESCEDKPVEEPVNEPQQPSVEVALSENDAEYHSSDNATLEGDEPAPDGDAAIQEATSNDEGDVKLEDEQEKSSPSPVTIEKTESVVEATPDQASCDESSQQSAYAADDESRSGSIDDQVEGAEMVSFDRMSAPVTDHQPVIGNERMPLEYKRDVHVLESPVSDDEEEVALRLPPRPADSPTLGASRTSTETSQDSTSQEMLPPPLEQTSQESQPPLPNVPAADLIPAVNPLPAPHDSILPAPPQPQHDHLEPLPHPPYSHHPTHYSQPTDYKDASKYPDSPYPPHRPYKDMKYPPTEYPDMEASHLLPSSVYYNDSSRQVSDVGELMSHNGSLELPPHVMPQHSPSHHSHDGKTPEQLSSQDVSGQSMAGREAPQITSEELPQLTEEEMMPHMSDREMSSQLSDQDMSSQLTDQDMAKMSDQDMPLQLASQNLMSNQDMSSQLTDQDLSRDDMPSQLTNQDIAPQLGSQDMPPQLTNQDLLSNQSMTPQQVNNQDIQQLNRQETASHIESNSTDPRSHPPPSVMSLQEQSTARDVRNYDENATDVTDQKGPSSTDVASYVQHDSAPATASSGDMSNYSSHDSSAPPHSISYMVQAHDADRSHVYAQSTDTSIAQSAGRRSSDECSDSVPVSSENVVYRDPIQTSMSDMHSSKPSMYTTSESHDSLSHMQPLPGPANIISSLASMVRDPTHSLLPSTPPSAGQYLQPQFPSMTDYHRPMSCMPSLPSSGGTDYFNQFMPDCGNLQPPSSSLQSDRYNTTQSSLVQPPSAMPRSDQAPSSFQVLQQGTSAEFLRRASVSALADRNYTSPALLNSTGHQPSQWIGQESSRHWTQPSPLSLTPDLSTNSPLTKDPFFDSLDPNNAARKSAVSFGMSASRESVSDAMGHPHHLDMASMYMAGRYVTPAAAAAAANVNYQRHVTPSSGKPYDDTYRTTHMPDYRSLPQAAPPTADMFRVGMNPPPLALDKYNYARDFMYRSQHIGGGTAPFMSQTGSSQMNPYQDRDFARSAVYPQSSPYAFMGADKQYLSSRTKLGAGMPGISDRPMPNDYFPTAPPPPSASSQDPHHFQDPYRRSIYNMMNRYFE